MVCVFADAAWMDVCLGCTPVMPARDVSARLGVSRRDVHRLVDDGVLVRLDRFLVVGACLVEEARQDQRLAHRIKLDRLLHRFPDCAGSHESGALLHGLPLLDIPGHAVATRARGAWRSGDVGRIRIAPLPSTHVTEVDGVAVTSLDRTVVDIARTASMRAAMVVVDFALRYATARPALLDMVDQCSAWSDVGKARRAIDFGDARSESPLESVSRVIMHEYGLPPPEPQYEIDIGGCTYRVDFYWKHRRLVGEADGRAKYSRDETRSPAQVAWDEKVREDALRDADYGFVRWTYGQMLGRTDETIARIGRRLG